MLLPDSVIFLVMVVMTLSVVGAVGFFLVVTDSAPRGWATALGFIMMVGAVVGLFFMSSLVDRM